MTKKLKDGEFKIKDFYIDDDSGKEEYQILCVRFIVETNQGECQFSEWLNVNPFVDYDIVYEVERGSQSSIWLNEEEDIQKLFATSYDSPTFQKVLDEVDALLLKMKVKDGIFTK